MFKNDLITWALGFFKSVKFDNGCIVSTKPEYEYDLQTALVYLKFILQDSGVTRIPPGCKLVHQHYRDPEIFPEYKKSIYIILEHKTTSDGYIEKYLREYQFGFLVGFEMIKGKANDVPTKDNRFSHEKNLFDLSSGNALFKLAAAAITPEQLNKAQEDYERGCKISKEILNEIIK